MFLFLVLYFLCRKAFFFSLAFQNLGILNRPPFCPFSLLFWFSTSVLRPLYCPVWSEFLYPFDRHGFKTAQDKKKKGQSFFYVRNRFDFPCLAYISYKKIFALLFVLSANGLFFSSVVQGLMMATGSCQRKGEGLFSCTGCENWAWILCLFLPRSSKSPFLCSCRQKGRSLFVARAECFMSLFFFIQIIIYFYYYFIFNKTADVLLFLFYSMQGQLVLCLYFMYSNYLFLSYLSY